MQVDRLVVGKLRTNCYVVFDSDTKDCVVLDPGSETDRIRAHIQEKGLCCKGILVTHGHFDHTEGILKMLQDLPIPVYMNPMDLGPTSDQLHFCSPVPICSVAEGDMIQCGSLHFQVLECPGHSPGGVSYLSGKTLFTGDTLFRGTCGRWDIPGADETVLLKTLERLKNLPGQYTIYPGHGASTTLDDERRDNPFLQDAELSDDDWW